MNPEISLLAPMNIIGCKEKFSPSKGDFSGIQKAWERLFALPKGYIHNEIKNDQFWAVTSHIGEETLSYTAGGLVSSLEHLPKDMRSFYTPEQLFAIFEHYGNPQTMGETIHKAFEWIAQSEYESDGNYNLEMYDSRCNPEDPDSYTVSLYFPIRQKEKR